MSGDLDATAGRLADGLLRPRVAAAAAALLTLKLVAPFSPAHTPSLLSLSPLSGYEGAELNMELYWILLFSSVCPLAWAQGVYGKEPTSLSLPPRGFLLISAGCLSTTREQQR